jgi:hypothetical protein
MEFKGALNPNKWLCDSTCRIEKSVPNPDGRTSRPVSICFEAQLLNYGTPLPRQPKIKKITHITRNTKNKSFAIPADAAAMPPKPNTAAISAMIRKVIAQPNIVSPPLGMNRISRLPRVCFCFKSITRLGNRLSNET